MYDIIIGRSEKDRELYGKEGTIFLGKHYVKMGQTTSLSSKIYMDVTRSHVVFVCGKRGSGKSYTMGVIAEGVTNLPEKIRKNLAIVMLDTMGVYWTMKYPNDKEADLLKEWELEGKALDVKIYTPSGYYEKYKEQGVPTDKPFSIKPSELDPSDWCMTFNIEITSPEGVLIEKIINDLKETGKDYSVDDIAKAVQKDDKSKQETKDAVENRFTDSNRWGIFSKEGTPLKDLVKGGQVTVLDVGCYATTPGTQGLRALVIGLVAEKLFVQRMIARKAEELQSIKETTHFMGEKAEIKKKEPLVWLVIDECLPYSSKVETNCGVKKIGEVVKEFNKGKKINVIGYDGYTKKYRFYPVTKCYKRPKRGIIAFITETGQSIICTPDHKICSSKGFCEAQKAKDVAVPLLKPNKKDKRLIEARLLGSILGDGWLSTNGELIGFSGKGNNEDLEKIKEDLAELGFKSSSIHTRKTKSKIKSVKGKVANLNGTSSSVTSSTKAWRHFKRLGAPVGTKILVESKIPSWVLRGSKEVKCEFLAGLTGADGYIISRNVNVPNDFNPIRLSFNKIYSLKKNAFDFAEGLKKIFQDVGVRLSNICKGPGNIRKDGNKTFKIQITLAKSIDNTIRYLENVGYRYCEKKEIEGRKWLAYLKYRKNIIRERNKLRLKAIKLHKERGIGKVKIGKMLRVPDYIIRDWIYYGNKAGVPKRFPSFKEWTSKRVSGNNLFLKIIDKREKGQDIVYDLSIDKVHNFVADGFLVHNCHEFLPDKGETVASHPLQIILREGRQPGISLILASQQPGRIHTDVMTQSDIVIAHRITAKVDIEALGTLMQSYMRQGLDKQLNVLPRLKGSAIVFDDTNERMYPMRVRPRYTWHGGEAPTAIHKVKKVFEF